MRFQDLSILAKILSVVGCVSIATIGASLMGINALERLNEAAHEMDQTATQALLAARLNANVIALNRAQYQIAADASPQAVREVHEILDEERTTFKERLSRLKEMVGGTRSSTWRASRPSPSAISASST